MLVLTREVNESVTIGGNITVKVLSIHEHQVRLGFEAPKDIEIMRDEAKVREPKDKWPHSRQGS